MKKGKAPASPDDYVAQLSGWQHDLVVALRAAINSAAEFEETIKWHNLIFLANGPCILIHSEESRVLLGFWRGKRMVELDSRIRPSGKYELGNITFRPDTPVDADQIRRLAVEAGALNRRLGNPTTIS